MIDPQCDALAQALYTHANEIAGVQSLPWDMLCEEDPEIAAVYHCEAANIINLLAISGYSITRIAP